MNSYYLYLFEPRINTSIGFFSSTLISHTTFVSLFHKLVIPQNAGSNFRRFRFYILHRLTKATSIFTKENRSFTNGSSHGFHNIKCSIFKNKGSRCTPFILQSTVSKKRKKNSKKLAQ